MLSKPQIILLQTAVRGAGIRTGKDDRRYRMMLGQYKKSDGSKVTTCKELNNEQFGDLLAICEARGWRCPGKAEDHFRKKATGQAADGNCASYGQIAAIKHLARDLGWNEFQACGLAKRILKKEGIHLMLLTKADAYKVIEALKNMVTQKTGKKYKNLQEVKEDMEVSHVVTVNN